MRNYFWGKHMFRNTFELMIRHEHAFACSAGRQQCGSMSFCYNILLGRQNILSCTMLNACQLPTAQERFQYQQIVLPMSTWKINSERVNLEDSNDG